jgi:hypothetical protein
MNLDVRKLMQKLINLQSQMNEIDKALKNVRIETHNVLWDLIEISKNNKNTAVR